MNNIQSMLSYGVDWCGRRSFGQSLSSSSSLFLSPAKCSPYIISVGFPTQSHHHHHHLSLSLSHCVNATYPTPVTLTHSLTLSARSSLMFMKVVNVQYVVCYGKRKRRKNRQLRMSEKSKVRLTGCSSSSSSSSCVVVFLLPVLIHLFLPPSPA